MEVEKAVSTEPRPINYRRFEWDHLSLGDLGEVNKCISRASYNGMSCVWVQTPTLKCLSANEDGVILEFSKEHAAFYKWVGELDVIFKKLYMEKGNDVEEGYKSLILPGEKLGDLQRIALNFQKSSHGKVQTLVFNQRKKKMKVSDIKEGCDIVCILDLKGVKVIKNIISPVLEIIQVKLHTKTQKEKLTGYSFIEEDDDLKSVAPLRLSSTPIKSNEEDNIPLIDSDSD